ncbi:MAG: hypothetical protein ACK5BN_04660, partial [Planctomycetota bacterium]
MSSLHQPAKRPTLHADLNLRAPSLGFVAPAVTTFLRSGVRLAQIAPPPPPPPALATVPGPVTPAAAAVASPIGQDRGGDDGEPATAPAANAPAAAAMSATAGPPAPSDDETTRGPS